MQQKEQIKDRMLREAAQIWNVSEPVDENSFDPLVNMLVTALASEGELVYKEIEQTQNRVAGKLMSQLLPQVNKGVLPGHTLAVLSPSENDCTLPKYTELSIQHRMGSGTVEDFRFVTSQEVNLFKGHVQYMLGYNNNFKIEGNRYKTICSNIGQDVEPDEVCLGIQLLPKSRLAKKISLYIDVKRSNIFRDNFYELLSSATFYVEGEYAESSFSTESSNLLSELTVQRNVENPLVDIEKSIIDYYQNQFFTIDIPDLLYNKSELLNPRFRQEAQLIWLKIKFKSTIDSSVFEDMMCYTNVVPIVNLAEHTKIYKSNKDLSIINLNAEESIYAVKSVSDENGKKYHEYNSSNKDRDNTKATYLLRKDDVTGFSDESANNMISYLIGKLRNENACFAQLNKGNFTNDIKTLGQITRRLEQSMGSFNKLNDSLYMFINDSEIAENVFVDFYTTKGSKVKDIKNHASLTVTKGSLVQQSGNFIVAPIVGGRDALTEEQKFYHVRHAMLSGDKVVTPKDITSLMQKYWGEDVKCVSVKKGLMNNEDIQSGYIRTVDIYVDTFSQDEREGFYIGKQALCELVSKSSNVYPYRLFVDNKQVSQN